MKYTKAIAIIFLLIFSSCSKQPSCDDDESLELAKQLIVQEMDREIGLQYKMIGIDVKEILEKFIDENIEIVNARTTAIDEKLRKCDCSSEISIKYSDDFIKKIKEHENKKYMNGVLTSFINKQLNYNYTLQIINKKEELFIEGILPIKELNEAFSFYFMTSIEFNKKNKNQVENINYKKSDQNLQDSITDINVMDRDGINDDSNYDNIKSYDNYEADVDKAIEMLKRGKSVREIADSTVLLKEDIRKLKRKLRND